MKRFRKKIFLFGLIVLLTSIFVKPSYAFLGLGSASDVIAQMQRAVMIVESKLRTLQTVMLVQQTINSVRTAKMMYEMGKRAYEQLRDPNEWRRLVEFTKRSLERVIDFDGNPYDSPLYRSLVSLDKSLDSYLESLIDLDEAMITIDSIDRQFAGYLGQSGPNWILKGEVWSKSVEGKAQALADAKKNIKQFQKVYNQSLDQSQNIVKEIEEINCDKKEFSLAMKANLEAKRTAEQRMNNSDNPGEKQSYYNRLSVLDMHMKEFGTLEKKIKDKESDLVLKLSSIESTVQEAKNGLEQMKQKISMLGFLELSWMKVSLSSMKSMPEKVMQIQVLTFKFLIVPVAFGLIVLAMNSFKGAQTDVHYHVFWGLISAVVFLAPWSPLSFHRIVMTIAYISDGIALQFQNMAGGPVNTMLESLVRSGATIAVNAADAPQNSGWSIQNFNPQLLVNIAAGALHHFLMNTISNALAILAIVPIFISLFLRNLLFWVCAAVAPLFIVLAPLPWARKHLIPRWGSMFYATILWGPVIYIMLTITNTMIIQMSSYSTVLGSKNILDAGQNILIAGFSAVVMTFAMLLSPVLVFGIVQGSFGALTGSVASAGIKTLSATAMAGVAGTGMGLKFSGNLMQMSGQHFNAASGFFNSRGYGGVGNKLTHYGSKMTSTGSKMFKTGVQIKSTGKEALMIYTGLSKYAKAKDKERRNLEKT